MNTFLLYSLVVAIYLTAFYILYSLFLSRDTTYNRNRLFIIASLILAFILPLLTVQTSKFPNAGIFGRWLSEVLVTGESVKAEDSGLISDANAGFAIVYYIYLAGVFVFLAKILIDLCSIALMITRHRKQGTRIIRSHSFNTSGFSAMGYIFLKSGLNDNEEAEIIRHEQNHLQKNHFLDILLVEFVKAFQWFNPMIYLFNRSLRAVHEYQADLECLRSGTNVPGYQHLLLSQIFRSTSLSLSNSFSNPSLVRKRMLMMTKKRTPAYAGMKLMIVVPLIGLLFITVSSFRKNNFPEPDRQSMSSGTIAPVLRGTSNHMNNAGALAGSEESDSMPYTTVQIMPEFPGGDAELLNYIARNAHYPESAKEQGIHGKVVVRFCVTSKGGITLVSVLKSVSPELDAEAVRVVKTLPAFKPGIQDGKAVATWFMVPITFTLK